MSLDTYVSRVIGYELDDWGSIPGCGRVKRLDGVAVAPLPHTPSMGSG